MNSTEQLRPLVEDDLDMLRAWRNSPQVRQFMYSPHVITSEEHARWWKTISGDSRCHAMLFVSQGAPSGYVKIGPVNGGGIASWGFYAAPDAPKGTGRRLGHAALAHAFIELSLHKLCGEALGFNTASCHLHRRLGFRQEGVRVDQYFDGRDYHDVVLFGLTAEQWRAYSQENNYGGA